ncbi:hypothetical protein BO94DRAFT_555077 [Aspergillus sclerotioniger CBS 115572]|uniref:HAD-like protein n=1 Tax=Aspergillus sclerotioniger CBS 115572 TaxID=1450535 RepID=A0A317X5T5_9EURO|nr:hypothetical protein BO94DRAFT_555077 [Aspergillus sclerotioniger CBS 115572]PWY91910.1 hypothetical protein BO94DRAFT_555077 [Aspergillus sclerotioniger CBS 115572]
MARPRTDHLLEKYGKPAFTPSLPDSIFREQSTLELKGQMRRDFSTCTPLRGVEELLSKLVRGNRKPARDIYLVALEALNSALGSEEKAILPEECLVFEDSVIGVEARRRAGMRVVWVPHPDVAVEYRARQKDVLAGRTGMIEIGDDWQLERLMMGGGKYGGFGTLQLPNIWH